MRAFLFPIYAPLVAIRRAKKVIAGLSPEKNETPSPSPEPELYFHVHSRKWFNKEIRRLFDFELVVWRSVNVPFLKIYIHRWLFGEQVLSLIYWLEDRFPHFFGRFGAYPIIIIRK
jgi:hypothetical protein